MANRWGNSVKQWLTLFWGVPKSLQMVTAAMKLKDACSLKENLDSILKRDITLLTKVHLVKAMVFPLVMYGCELDYKESWVMKNWCFWTVVLEKTVESPLDWCWSWNSSTLATWCEELTHWERPWGWERLRAGGKGGDRGWDSYMVSLTGCTWVWANSGT